MNRLIGLLYFALSFLLLSVTAEAQSYCVKSDAAKLFSVTDENSKVIWRAPIYTPLMGTGNRKEIHGEMWAEVLDADSQKYWIQKTYLTTKLNCLVVSVNRTHLRSGPGTNYASAKVRFAQKHQAFIDLGGEDGWTQVRDKNGVQFWVDMDHTWKAKSKMRISFEEK